MKMFTDLLAAVAKSLKNNTSRLSLEDGVSQSSGQNTAETHVALLRYPDVPISQ
jgi:hypothetical protein